MEPFRYLRAEDERHALAASKGATYIAGGTTLVDLMRLGVMRPRALVDISGLGLAAIDADDGGVRIGAMARNTDVAVHPVIAASYPVLSEALLSGASPQLRNMATTGGNVLQRTRCAYFRDPAARCNKRDPGAGCGAIGGHARMHAVLGVSDRCIATHPSDMCVALVALDAVVRTRAPSGAERAIAFADFHLEPGAHPEVENVLAPGELITHVELPKTAFSARSHYLKVRDRASYAFALVSAAVALHVDGGVIRECRVGLGGVATKPWRSAPAEAGLVGKSPSVAVFRAAAEAAMKDATAQPDNAFKIELAKRTLVRALVELTERA
ncbi:MAG TPA: xanthine dehydrogenase family protein subunit M [Polyangiaceae bacterium]|jgi:xanthine dehydrogenase YagS FAD-binding subunit|nr:xanthine dehydrogenase family protein subunit M [Polyangiaceae bacterium]